ncbi:hypothetical protein ABT024_11150 [Streptomyces sp. NPDC002812]|uniref:hypothetical protein n=1 Tax=unclassified Streptomyces TaxID=2593676 RepID=UPI00202E6ECC|nr:MULTISPECIES: hypothetical protein [unclassified Streptomyces]MCM1969247.1 hypothetical protein [Streptomyces sp. G1]MCX5122843.1 hypothetical protein [Streptomyces sp. NBC_00347]MCX5296200.1 hypothetical protein [Streptomyces sp. NBC_00193]MCX5404961.1 hypothetical protein [Streptomyces sp. NBC_00086]
MDSESDQQPKRPAHLYTGSEHPFDPEDLVMARGQDPTPERVEKARKLIEKEGARALERYLP